MKKFLLTLLYLFFWIDGSSQVTELFTLPADTTLTVNTTGSNPTELNNYPSPSCGSWSLTNKLIFSFLGDGEYTSIRTENIGYDTYLYLYEKINDSTYLFLTCNDDDFEGGFFSLASRVNWVTEVGKEYHVILGGFLDNNGITDLRLFQLQYCNSKGTRNNFEWIKRVELGGDIDNTSGKNTPAYEDYTSHLLNADTNEVVTVALTPGYRRRVYREYWRIWVDWNFDGDFDDTGEKVFEKNGKNIQSGSFTVPVFVDSNALRMRVSMRWRRYPPSCGNYANGEVEDYKIKVNGAQGIFDDEEEPEDNFDLAKESYSEVPTNNYEFTDVFPNPVIANDLISGIIRVENTGVKQLIFTNVLGQIVKTTSIECNEEESRFEIPTDGLSKGVYFLTLPNHQDAVKIIIQ